MPAVQRIGRGYGTVAGDGTTRVYSDKRERMNITEEMGVVIKVMRLLRQGKIDRHTTNIEVLKMVINNKE
jgi:hypothetical protein